MSYKFQTILIKFELHTELKIFHNVLGFFRKLRLKTFTQTSQQIFFYLLLKKLSNWFICFFLSL